MHRWIVVISGITLFLISVCFYIINYSSNTEAVRFKEEYEMLNSEDDKHGQFYRSVTIDKINPFVYITPEELLAKLDERETFYIYFGSPFCPWCRCIIEKAIEVSGNKGIQKIYYIDVGHEGERETFRDKYIVNDNNKLEQSYKGTKTYYEILKRFDKVLSDYTLTDKNGNEVEVNEKRIFAPNFVFVKNGDAKDLIVGISEKLTSPLEKLTEEVLKDEEIIFNDFFKEGYRFLNSKRSM